MKECTTCGVRKPLDDFNRNCTRKDGRLEQCRLCKAAADRKRYHAPDGLERAKRIKKDTEYSKRKSVRFSRKAGSANKQAVLYNLPGRLLSSEVMGLFLSHSYSCYYCGKQSTDPKEMTLDHVVPMSRGGDNHISNCVPACWDCNLSKGNKSEKQFVTILNNRGN